MSSASHHFELISVEDYLAGEVDATVKHEYVDGRVYAMAGGTVTHALIASNVLASLHNSLSGTSCMPFGSDMRLRIQLPTGPRYYYPDVSVVCDSNSSSETFQEAPVLLVEVVSEQSRRIDDGEKREAYFSIPSLKVYLLIEQETPAVKVFRRTSTGFAFEIVSGLDAVIDLKDLGCQLSLAAIYERVRFNQDTSEEKSN